MRDPRHEAVYAFLANERDQLIRLDALLRKTATPHDLAWAVADFVGRVLMLDDCVVYFTEPDGAHLLQYAAYGQKRVAERIFENRIELPFGHGIVGACAQFGRPQLVPDTRRDPRYVVDDAARLSEIAIPMLHEDRTVGVIDSEHPEPAYFAQVHIDALTRVADRAAQTLVLL